MENNNNTLNELMELMLDELKNRKPLSEDGIGYCSICGKEVKKDEPAIIESMQTTIGETIKSKNGKSLLMHLDCGDEFANILRREHAVHIADDNHCAICGREFNEEEIKISNTTHLEFNFKAEEIYTLNVCKHCYSNAQEDLLNDGDDDYNDED